MTPRRVQVGEFQIRETGEHRPVPPGETPSRIPASGDAELFEVVGPDVKVEVGFICWSNGEKDVHQLSRVAGPEPVDGLTGRLRMSVCGEGDESWCEVARATVREGGHVGYRRATLEQLDAAMGVSCRETLRQLGGSLGTRAQLLHEEGRRRDYLCIVFPRYVHIVPVAAFVMSKLAPLVSHARQRPTAEPDTVIEVRRLLARSESATVEFKASARWDVKLKRHNKALEDAVVKTVCGFANSRENGTLVLGVADDRSVVGLGGDFKLVHPHGADGFENWLMTLLIARTNKDFAAGVRISMAEVHDRDVCVVGVEPSTSPVFDNDGKNARFWLRMGNSTRELTGEELFKYLKRRFI